MDWIMMAVAEICPHCIIRSDALRRFNQEMRKHKFS